jgi:CheY-like chemotaxis protein
MTAYDEPAAREEAETMGSYLAKPFSGRTLLAVIAKALH